MKYDTITTRGQRCLARAAGDAGVASAAVGAQAQVQVTRVRGNILSYSLVLQANKHDVILA